MLGNFLYLVSVVMAFVVVLFAPVVAVLSNDSMTLSEKEVAIALQLVDQLTGRFDPKNYKDEYTGKLLARIQAKIEGREVAKIEAEEPVETQVVDLVAKLKESLERKEGERRAAEG